MAARPAHSTLRVPAFLVIAVFAAGFVVAHFTVFGRNVYALGGNAESARLMGLPVAQTQTAVYAVSGFCSALAGVVATLYTGSGNPAMGVGLELDAIAAVVIGGTLLTGGVGFLVGEGAEGVSPCICAKLYRRRLSSRSQKVS